MCLNQSVDFEVVRIASSQYHIWVHPVKYSLTLLFCIGSQCIALSQETSLPEIPFSAMLTGQAVVPPSDSARNACARLWLRGTNLFYRVAAAGITGTGGIYGPAAPGTNGPLMHVLAPDHLEFTFLEDLCETAASPQSRNRPGLAKSVSEGVFAISEPTQIAELFNGLWYLVWSVRNHPGALDLIRGQIVFLDSDDDGVPDLKDHCTNTVSGSAVDTNGCSIEQLCPCDGAWKNHSEFVKCVRSKTHDFSREGLISEEQRAEILREATASDCGDKKTWRWEPRSNTNAPSARERPGAVWTGKEVLIWGGYNGDQFGGAYDPATDRWRRLSTNGAPTPRAYHTTVWTGRKMIIWGGFTFQGNVNDGAVYDPEADVWMPTNMEGAPGSRSFHLAFWTGREMLVLGGGDGGRYNPETDSWSAISTSNSPPSYGTAVWTGKEVIVCGVDSAGEGPITNGGRYDPVDDLWSPISIQGAPSLGSSVWTGTRMIVWGQSPAAYDPSSNSWSPISTNDMPPLRFYHSTVWTGTEMIVWGGLLYNDGGRYDPTTDTWTPMSLNPAPPPRDTAAAVWIGDGMIIFGGWEGGNDYVQNTWCYKPPGPYAGDGLPDDWQRKYFGKTGGPIAAPSADPDGDGQNNRFEYFSGTNPTKAESHFRSHVQFSPSPLITFSPALRDRKYTVLYTTNLGERFRVLENCYTFSRDSEQVVLDLSPQSTCTFYRISIAP